jgi:Asp-tRNA(Asn)/Glu-tRNA(Gln) amidotransferase A subunit family amidase
MIGIDDDALSMCRERIRTLEPAIQAWVQVSPQRPTGEGPLNGVPFGVKDIIETEGLATEYGSPIYKGRVGTEDAAIVRSLRERGAILLGKTACAAFAHRTPASTRNPRDLARTPGGSSSGSAAAVAAGMVPIAIGTQTKGSILRPASYCGVSGFKASYGLLPTDGVLPLARSLDTLGFFTPTAADMLELWTSLGHPVDAASDVPLGAPDSLDGVEPEMAAAFERSLARLRAAGFSVKPLHLADMLTALSAACDIVMHYEGAREHEQRFNEHGERLDDLAVLVRAGLQIPAPRYHDARTHIDGCKLRMAEIYAATPVILLPAATGAAPRGLASTGDPRMNAPWTALGTPAISIPMPVGGGLPLGLQLTAAHGDDGRLLRAAVGIEQALGV